MGFSFKYFKAYLDEKLGQIIAAIGGGGGVNNTIDFIVDDISVAAQTTPVNKKSFTLYFIGANGKINGKIVPNGYVVQYGNGKDKITNTLEYLRPAAGKVIITTIE